MRFPLFLLLLLSNVDLFAQNYYQPAYDLSGNELKAALHNLIDDHIEFPYTSGSTDTWDILKESDRDPNDTVNVILVYSGRSVDAAQEYNSGKGWTREHVWAKSRGDFGTDEGAGTDLHHLKPCDNSINTTRNNRNFDECINCKEIIDEDENTRSFYDENLWTFEPRDEVKGDVARMILYMAIRYEGDNGELDLELQEEYLDKSDKSPYHSILSVLLKWHEQDPVDLFEQRRNDVIYKYQKNRNPLIDHPELVDFIWGDKNTWVWNPETSVYNNEPDNGLFPNPTNGILNVTFEYDYLILIDVGNGNTLTKYTNEQTFNVQSLAPGMYALKVYGGRFSGSMITFFRE
jgi:endonuclease I